MWNATVLTLYPEMFPGPLGVSLAGEALKRGDWRLEAKNIREHGLGRHRAVDDTPAGGGPGMVMRCDVLAAALDAAAGAGDARPRLLMSPRAVPLRQDRVRALARGPGVLLIQLGTPDAPTPQALRPYLRQFLSDPRVIENQSWKWKLILNGIILRTRPAASAAKYQRIWDPKTGSPL